MRIARAVTGNLSMLLGTPDVAVAPLATFNPAYRVTINIQRFESVADEAVLAEAVWAVRKTAGGEPRSGRTVARETVQGEGFDALAAAHNRALAKVSGDIAAAIRGVSRHGLKESANAKFEIRNSKQIQNPKFEGAKRWVSKTEDWGK